MDTIRITTRRYTFEIVRETAEEYQPTVGSPEVAAKLARRVIGCELSEVVIAMMLDSRHRVLGYTEVSRGTVNASRLTPRDVFHLIVTDSAHYSFRDSEGWMDE
jgi:DNA repair protein RadC